MTQHDPQITTHTAPAFATGFGQHDTHKATGQSYSTITGRDIVTMIQTPQAVAKDKAQWLIPSSYHAADARCHDAQRTHGQFWFLTLDIDQNDLDMADIDKALSEVIGDACRLVYSSRSATADNRKWRALVPLASPIAGADYADTQNAFFNLLEQASDGVLIPDRALARPGQLVYLPNRGEFYQHHIEKGQRLVLTDHPIIVRRDAIRADLTAAAKEASAARNKRAAERLNKAVGGDASPVDTFNAAHSVADLLARYGYAQVGQSNDWRSPYQTGGSYATRAFDGYWVSLSGSDAAQEIGAATQNGYRHGDAFDLFAHFEHGGNFTAAVAAYGAEIRPERAARQRARDAGPDDDQAGDDPPPEPRSFDELLEAAKALEPGQIDETEAVVSESAGLNPMRRDAIFRAIKDATGIPLGTIRDQLSRERDAIPEPDHLDLAGMTLAQIGRDNVICTNAFVWRWQSRGVWTEQDDRAIKQAVQSRLDDEFLIDVTCSLVNGVTDVLKSDIYRPEHKFNRGNPETVNCLSGEIELHQGRWTLRPHCRENYRTTQIPVAYDPKADAPLFRAFLAQVFRDDPDRDDKTRAVLELMGYTLMSHARHEKFIMLIGPGANGKSVLLAVLEGLLGAENVAGVQPANFDNRFQRAHLHQKLANIVTELRQGEVIADAELKAITSGEPATVEHKHKDPFVMRPFATC